jgi:hypothetical protein
MDLAADVRLDDDPDSLTLLDRRALDAPDRAAVDRRDVDDDGLDRGRRGAGNGDRDQHERDRSDECSTHEIS